MVTKKTELLVEEVFKASKEESLWVNKKVICMDCKSNMIKSSVRHKYKYYRCYNYVLNPRGKICTSHLIAVDILNQAVKERFLSHLSHERQQLYDVYFETKLALKDEELENLNKNIDFFKCEISKICRAKINKTIEEDKFLKDKSIYMKLLKEAELKRNLYNLKKESLSEVEFQGEFTYDFHLENQDLEKNMFKYFIDHIEVGEKDKLNGKQNIKIYWKFTK